MRSPLGALDRKTCSVGDDLLACMTMGRISKSTQGEEVGNGRLMVLWIILTVRQPCFLGTQGFDWQAFRKVTLM